MKCTMPTQTYLCLESGGGRTSDSETLTSNQKASRKFARNRASHCNDGTFTKMYDQVEDAAVESGNAKRLEEPVLMNMDGEIVVDEALAFGRPVSIEWTRP